MTTVKSYPATSQGRRKNNEDSFSYFEPGDPVQLKSHGCLYVIADGVGGATGGERASLYAAENTVDEYYQSFEEGIAYLPEPLGDLSAILQRINEKIYNFATERGIRMATTIVAAVTRGEYLYLVNVGDSRAYLIRNNIAEQITHDHSLVGEMVRQREMTEAEAMASKIKNRLTRSLGGDPEVTVGTYGPYKLQNGDKILLCSDGLTRYATIQDITAMTATGNPKEVAEGLVKFADECGGADNTTVILVSYQPDEMVDTVVSTTPRLHTAHLLEDETVDSVSADTPTRVDKKTLSYLAMAMAAFVIAAGIGLTIFFSGRTPKPAILATSNLPIMISPSVVPVTATPISIPSETAIVLPTALPPITQEMQTLQATQIPIQGLCTVLVSDEDSLGLGGILQKFGLIYDGQQKYQSCEDAECVHQTVILNHNEIQPGLIVIIPDVSELICDNGGGTWIMSMPASLP